MIDIHSTVWGFMAAPDSRRFLNLSPELSVEQNIFCPSQIQSNAIIRNRTSAQRAHNNLMDSSNSSSRKFWGILVRDERWRLSWRGLTLVLTVSAGLVLFAILNVHWFLAVTDRVKTDTLVVEGWVHKYAIQAAVKEFENGSYQRAFSTGGPAVGNGGYVNDYQTAASVGANLLEKMGLPGERLEMVPSREMNRDRTYGEALALRQWFQDHSTKAESFNIVTEDLHGRRTRLLYQRAFGNGVRIGVIAVPSPDYDASRWWRYSEGVEGVLNEGIGYIYARFFFWPRQSNLKRTG